MNIGQRVEMHGKCGDMSAATLVCSVASRLAGRAIVFVLLVVAFELKGQLHSDFPILDYTLVQNELSARL